MTSRELAHIDFPRYLGVPGALSALATTPGLDTLNYESAAILVYLPPGNLGAAISATLTLQESDVLASGYTNVDPMYVEWFQDGVPGNLTGALGSQVWTPGLPGYNGALQFATETGVSGHIYAVSYVGGQRRYIRLSNAVAGAPNNVTTLLGLLDRPRATAIRPFNNYPVVADFPSIAFPT